MLEFHGPLCDLRHPAHPMRPRNRVGVSAEDKVGGGKHSGNQDGSDNRTAQSGTTDPI
jgi:hypothetical protein